MRFTRRRRDEGVALYSSIIDKRSDFQTKMQNGLPLTHLNNNSNKHISISTPTKHLELPSTAVFLYLAPST